MRFPLALLLCSLSLSAQESYGIWDKNVDVCARQEQRGSSPFHQVETVEWTTGTVLFPREKRKDVSNFSVLNESGHEISIKEFKGKLVIVGLWSTHCEPSLFLLGDMAQLFGKGAKFGFEMIPTSIDTERWSTITPFLNQKRMKEALKGVTIYTPALGEKGVHQFMDVVPALPTFFIIDREGRVAAQSFGYKAGELSKWLKVLLAESATQGTSPATTPKTPAPDAPKEKSGKL